jgi:negative regulator of sigma E activity
MKHLFTTPGCVILTLVFFALGSVIAPATASAGWDDRSGNLPGMHEFPTELVVLTVVALGAAVTYAIVKHNSKKKQLPSQPAPTATDADDTQKSDSITVPVEQQETKSESGIQETTRSTSKLELFLDARPAPQPQTLSSERQRFDLSTVAVRAGISFSF